MMERVEINNDLTRNEPVREVRQTKDAHINEATKKKFVAELERRLSGKKRKNRKREKDEIILCESDAPDREKKHDINENENTSPGEENPTPSPDGSKGTKIDLIA